jgi:hypothetical protein
VALPPSLEPRKMTGIVLQTVPYRRTIVTELRHAVGAAGGGITSWDQKTRTVVASFGGKKISLQIDRPIAYIGGKKVMLSQAPRINSSGRTMVDIRLLKAVLGARIELDKSSRQYVLNS